MKVNIFVEGYEDQELVAALLVKLGKVVSWQEAGKAFSSLTTTGNQINLNATEGWTKLTNGNLFPGLQQSLQEEVLNLVIYDADRPGRQQGGYKYRKDTLLQMKENNHLSFELFLLPNNNQDGQLEDLLENLIQPDHQQVVDCFANYEACMRGCVTPTGVAYRLPADKSKFYAYVEAMPITDEERKAHKSKGATKYFANEAYWNLDAGDAQPLREFLDRYVQ